MGQSEQLGRHRSAAAGRAGRHGEASPSLCFAPRVYTAPPRACRRTPGSTTSRGLRRACGATARLRCWPPTGTAWAPFASWTRCRASERATTQPAAPASAAPGMPRTHRTLLAEHGHGPLPQRLTHLPLSNCLPAAPRLAQGGRGHVPRAQQLWRAGRARAGAPPAAGRAPPPRAPAAARFAAAPGARGRHGHAHPHAQGPPTSVASLRRRRHHGPPKRREQPAAAAAARRAHVGARACHGRPRQGCCGRRVGGRRGGPGGGGGGVAVVRGRRRRRRRAAAGGERRVQRHCCQPRCAAGGRRRAHAVEPRPRVLGPPQQHRQRCQRRAGRGRAGRRT